MLRCASRQAPRWFRGARLVMVVLVAACVPRSVPLAPGALGHARALAAAGDTNAALALLDSIVLRDGRDAAAWHERGLLSWAKARPSMRGGLVMHQADISLQRIADSSLRLAAVLAPDSGRFALDLGRYFLYANVITMRVQAPSKFRQAADAARRAGDRPLLAEAEDELGMVNWRRYEAVADRRALRGLSFVDADAMLGDRHAAKNVLETYSAPYSDPPGALDYTQAVDHFTAALSADAGNARASRHTFMALAEQRRWEELRRAADARLASSPDDAFARMARGLAAHRAGDESAATTAFDSALALLPERERGRYTRLSRILRPADSASYEALGDSARRVLDAEYWTLADPLTLTPDNEHRLEFLSRVSFAELRWTSDDFDLRGADTDRGQILVRYGPPPVIASFAPSTEWAESCSTSAAGESSCSPHESGVGTILWYYPALSLEFVFRAPPTYGTASFAGDYAARAADARAGTPVSWSNLDLTRSLDSVGVQLARFRAADSVDLAVYARVPIQRMSRGVDLVNGVVDVAFTLYGPHVHRLVRDSSRETVVFRQPGAAEKRSWRHRLAPGAITYRIEAWQGDAGRGARALGALALPRERGFGVSDLVVADRVQPRVDSAAARRWSDLLIVPNVGVLARGQELGLMWETYELATDGGTNRYRVELALTVLEVARPAAFAARIIGGIADAVGLSAKGDDRLTLSYTRQRAAAPVALDWLTLELGDAPAGRYRLAVEVTDLVTGRRASRARELRIVE